ncbi:MAG: tyrosine--tRNA ligase [Luteitalea sp.]|nr:tyrosine--tRNA ligase [Luteitalea sp.]
MMTLDQEIAYLTKGCVDVVRPAELRDKLERAHRERRQLTVKVGFDPTAPDLHLGHTVLLRKMKHFQDLGHRVIFLIGDFTGLIGDPTGQSKTRPALTPEQIAANAETYKSQVFKLLDANKTVVDFNSRWFGAMTSEEWVRLAARYNVAQMLERREFRQRYESGQPISLHEFLYPLVQGYDSVVLRADVELGGTDQLFNLNVGRDIMPGYGLEPQVVMTTPLLVGLDGVEKMSKSLGNYVGVDESPNTMFGKLMSISDELMWVYYELLTDLPVAELHAWKREVAAGSRHPKRVKLDLAKRIVTDFHSPAAAEQAETWFEQGRKSAVEPEGDAGAVAGLPVLEVVSGSTAVNLSRAIADLGLAASASEATRKIKQGGVRINGEKVVELRWQPPGAGRYVLQVGAHRMAVLQARAHSTSGNDDQMTEEERSQRE